MFVRVHHCHHQDQRRADDQLHQFHQQKLSLAHFVLLERTNHARVMHPHQQTSQQTQIRRLSRTEPLLHQQLLGQVMFYQFQVDHKVKHLLEFSHQLLCTFQGWQENL